jgi:hypothetical protein
MTILLKMILVWLLLNAVYFLWVAEGRYRRRTGFAATQAD